MIETSTRIGITAFFGCSLAVVVAAQNGARLVRVEGPMESYGIDRNVGFAGEYHVLRPGKHTLEFAGVHRSRLVVTLDIGGSGVRVTNTSVSDVCADSTQTGDTEVEVRRWPVDIASDPKVKEASVVRLREPVVDRRTRALTSCAASPWDRQATWPLEVTSTPRAAISAGAKLLDSTEAKVAVPYGISDHDGKEEEVYVRIHRTAYIGCTFRLSDLRKDKSNDVSCDLTSPVAPSSRP